MPHYSKLGWFSLAQVRLFQKRRLQLMEGHTPLTTSMSYLSGTSKPSDVCERRVWTRLPRRHQCLSSFVWNCSLWAVGMTSPCLCWKDTLSNIDNFFNFKETFDCPELFYNHVTRHIEIYPKGNRPSGGCRCQWEGRDGCLLQYLECFINLV